MLEFGIWNFGFRVLNLDFGIWNLEFGNLCFCFYLTKAQRARYPIVRIAYLKDCRPVRPVPFRTDPFRTDPTDPFRTDPFRTDPTVPFHTDQRWQSLL